MEDFRIIYSVLLRARIWYFCFLQFLLFFFFSISLPTIARKRYQSPDNKRGYRLFIDDYRLAAAPAFSRLLFLFPRLDAWLALFFSSSLAHEFLGLFFPLLTIEEKKEGEAGFFFRKNIIHFFSPLFKTKRREDGLPLPSLRHLKKCK